MRLILLISILLFNGVMLLGQSIVTGTVKDEQKLPIPGTTVVVMGTQNGTTTDLDGNFSIKAKKDDTIVISFIGYKSEQIIVGDSEDFQIELVPSIETLDEVVTTAIGIKQQKKRIGYATEQVKTDVLEQSRGINLGNALSGQVAGLTVTNPTGVFQAPDFDLRGKTPLIVLDGVPIETDFFDIPTENIGNVNVLKGTSASALYGSRGRNGAILLTSKKGTVSGLTTTISSSFMATAGYVAFPDAQHEYGSGSNGEYEFWDGQDGGISDGDMTWGPKFEGTKLIAQWNSPIRDIVTGEITPWWGDVSGTRYDDRSKYERVPIEWEQHDNLKNFLEVGVVSSTDISISQKSDRGQFMLTSKYAYQKGQVPNTKVHSGSLNFNGTYKLSNDVTVDGALSYSKVYSPNYPRYGYGPKNHMYTILVWMGDDVDGEDLKNHMWVPGQEGSRQANYNYAWYNNPYFSVTELTQIHDRNVINGQLKLRWDIDSNLSIQGRGAVRVKDLFEDMKVPKSYMNYGDSRDGDYKIWNSEQTNVDVDILATYTSYISDDFEISANIGASYFYRTLQSDYSATDGLIVAGISNLGNSKGPVTATNSLNQKATNSVYATATMSLFESWFVTLTGRNDWSSTMPAQNNSYFYPSLSVSTTLSDYVKLPAIFDYMKVYGSWAQVSSDLDPYEISSTYSSDGTYGTDPKVTYPSDIANSDIKPEQSNSTEFGLSTSILSNRLSLEATYYSVIDKNQIIDLPLSEASGFTSRKVNGNEYKSSGLEIALKGSIIKHRAVKWDARTNWSFNKKVLTKIYGGGTKYNNLQVGDRADDMWGTVWQKSGDGKLIIDANTGLPVKDEHQRRLGHTTPDAKFGFQNTLTYKRFSLNVDFDGVIGGVMWSKTIEKLWWGGRHPESTTYRDAEYDAGVPIYIADGVNVVTDGTVEYDNYGEVISDSRSFQENSTAVSWQTWCQNYPYRAYVTEDENKTFASIFDRSYLKLRKVALTYKCGGSSAQGIKAPVLSIFANNVAMWKHIPLVDPDFKTGNDDDLQDPSARYIGVSAKFTL